ncbi:aprataxin-like protein [Cryptotrichosporon argae]
MLDLSALRKAATLAHPDLDLPSSAYLLHTPSALVVFDKFPKAKYHFLVLPRHPRPASGPGAALPLSALGSLRDMAREALENVREVVEDLVEVGKEVVEMVREEMVKTEGFEWGVQMGFHAQPSMPHLHLHVISTDLVAPALKTKRHYNTFRPAHGFFLDAADVIGWLASGADVFRQHVADLDGPRVAALEKSDLVCWRCGQAARTMPALKAHLLDEFERLRAAGTGGAGGASGASGTGIASGGSSMGGASALG